MQHENGSTRGHTHAEAFMLMRYEGTGGRREWIWNSRDGITPFCVHSVDGVEMQHGNWHLDRYEPNWVPQIDTRIFVDLTEEIARPKAVAYVEKHWNDPKMPMSQHPVFEPLGKDGAVEHFVKAWVSDWGGHSPHVLTVTPAVHAQFKARAQAPRA
jgi:hypothetical protein